MEQVFQQQPPCQKSVDPRHRPFSFSSREMCLIHHSQFIKSMARLFFATLPSTLPKHTTNNPTQAAYSRLKMQLSVSNYSFSSLTYVSVTCLSFKGYCDVYCLIIAQKWFLVHVTSDDFQQYKNVLVTWGFFQCQGSGFVACSLLRSVLHDSVGARRNFLFISASL